MILLPKEKRNLASIGFAFLAVILGIHFSKSDIVAIKTPLLLGVVLWAPFLAAMPPNGSIAARRPISRPLIIACGLALALHLLWFAQRFAAPHLSDIASTSLAAIDALFAGHNPYHEAIDLAASNADPGLSFTGYKYLPAMLVAYLPTVGLLGERGILLTNLIADLCVAWLIFGAGRRIGGDSGGLAAAFLYLALPALMRQIYSKGANDVVAFAPFLLALLALPRRSWLSGFWLGLSIAAKPFPGIAFLPSCIPATSRERTRFAAGIVTGLLPIVPFALWSPADLFDNIVRFNLVRPAYDTSWVYYAPPAVASLARATFVLVFLGAAARFWGAPASLATRASFALVVAGCAILSSSVSNQNYLLWWLPLLCLLVGARGGFTPAAPVEQPNPPATLATPTKERLAERWVRRVSGAAHDS